MSDMDAAYARVLEAIAVASRERLIADVRELSSSDALQVAERLVKDGYVTAHRDASGELTAFRLSPAGEIELDVAMRVNTVSLDGEIRHLTEVDVRDSQPLEASELRAVERVVTNVRMLLDDGSLSVTSELDRTLRVLVDTAAMQFRSPSPDRRVLRATLRSIGAYLLGVASSATVVAIQHAVVLLSK